jgi:hypothetical protein
MKFSLIITLVPIFFIAATAGAKFECRFRIEGSWWALNGNFYICEVINLHIFNGHRVTIDAAEGLHHTGMTHYTVDGFVLGPAPYINRFPANIASVFPNLVLINIHRSKLTVITSDDLRPFPQLRILKIIINRVKVIDAGLLAHNPLLEVVDFEDNDIEHIDRHALSGLMNLRAIDLSANVCESLGQTTVMQEVQLMVQKIELGKCLSPEYEMTADNIVVEKKCESSDDVRVQLVQQKLALQTCKTLVESQMAMIQTLMAKVTDES